MSSDDSHSSKKLSLAETLMDAANPQPQKQELTPVSEEDIQKFEKFYNLVGFALWDIFTTQDIDKEESFYDYDFMIMPDCYFIAFCSGTFEEAPLEGEDATQFTVNKEEWRQDRHDNVGGFFESLDAIVKAKNLAGIVLEDREDMFSIRTNNPYSLIMLIENYLKKHDILTLDNVRPEDQGPKQTKPKKLEEVKKMADELREAAQQIWDTDCYSVGSNDEHIDIRYFPPAVTPTIDNADIALINAEQTEATAPFSLELIKNTYRDCLGIAPNPNCGLTLLH